MTPFPPPPSDKSAAYYSLFYRAFSIPLTPPRLEKELMTISQIARNNGFSDQFIATICRKVKKNMALRALHPSQDSDVPQYRTLTYFGSQSAKIGRILNSPNLQISFRAPTSLGQLLFNNKFKPDKTTRSGVYKLTCADCEACYVGQTGRSFATRKREHWRSFRLKREDESTFADHLIANNHNPGSELQILHLEGKGARLNILEGMEIYKHKRQTDHLLNDHADAFYSDLFSIL